MSESWLNVAENDDEVLKQFLREEGVPEEDLDKELAKLRENAIVSAQARGVLITPEVDATLKAIFEFAELHVFGSANDEKLIKAKEALWPK